MTKEEEIEFVKKIKRERNKYLAKKAEDLLFLSKRYKKLSYEEAYEQHTDMFYFAACIMERKWWEEDEKKKWVEAYMKRTVEVYKQLPQEIWDTIEDERAFCLGFMSKRTKKLLKKFFRKNI